MGEYLGNWIYYLLPLAGFFAFFALNYLAKSPGRALATKFGELGDLRGVALEEIVKFVGPPNGFSAAESGRSVQWVRMGYHITLVFGDDDKCLGVSHEFGA